jgi:hypothetical protein
MNRTRDRRKQDQRANDPAALLASPAADSAHPLLRLQKSAGNHVVQRLLKQKAGIIQRQPVPRGDEAIADPVAFIEGQLQRQFADPDDPRLAERVRRLEAAVRMLTVPEAKALSDRLRDPAGNTLSRNFQKLATPSRNRLLAVLRRGLPSDVEGKTLGTLYLAGTTAVGFPLVAQMEIVPSTEEPGAFGGYTDVGAARTVAVRRTTISAIVFDTRLQRFRVFETGVPINRRFRSTNVAAHETGLDYRLTEWVNLDGPEIPDWQERQKRIERAGALRLAFEKKYQSRPMSSGAGAADTEREKDLKEVQDAYKGLFEDVAPFARGEFHASMELEFSDPSSKSTRVTTADPSKINIDPFRGGSVHGYTKVLDPMTESAHVPGAHSMTSIASMVEEIPPVPYVPYSVLTAAAIKQEPLFTTGVIQHEFTHRAHLERAVELIEQWRSQSPQTSFQTWIESRVKARELSAVEAALAIEPSQKSPYLLPNTETLAEVEQFTSAFHAAALGGFGLDDLPQMASMWIRAEPAIQELAVRKLDHYYRRMLGANYRQAFDQKVVELLVDANSRSDSRQDFYVRLTEFSATTQ